MQNDYSLFFYLYRRVKRASLNKQDVTTLLKSQQDLKFMEEMYNDFIRKQQLEKEIDKLKLKLDNYDGLSPL